MMSREKEDIRVQGELDYESVAGVSIWDVLSGRRSATGNYYARFDASTGTLGVDVSGIVSVDEESGLTTIGGHKLSPIIDMLIDQRSKNEPIYACLWCHESLPEEQEGKV